MTETWRKRLVFGVLVVSLVWGYFELIPHGDKTPAATSGYDALPADPAAPTAAPPPAITDSLLAQYGRAAWGDDPFNRDLVSTAGIRPRDIPSLHLLGILYRQTGAQALINGRITGVGDIIEGYRIISITPDDVTVQSPQRTMVLRVGKESS